jgi:hypothetical protein
MSTKNISNEEKDNGVLADVMQRDLYAELRSSGSMTSDQCCEVLDWTEKLPIQIIGLNNVKVSIVQGVIRVEPNHVA